MTQNSQCNAILGSSTGQIEVGALQPAAPQKAKGSRASGSFRICGDRGPNENQCWWCSTATEVRQLSFWDARPIIHNSGTPLPGAGR